MKLFLTLFILLPLTSQASLDGVYHGSFNKNGYECEFNADIIQDTPGSITFKKWVTNCMDGEQQGPKTSVNGPLKYTFLPDQKVEVVVADDLSIYNTSKNSLTDSSFNLNYDFDAYLDGMVLNYDITIDLKLEKSVLKYTLKYIQNGQLIFSDIGIGQKLSR